MTCSILESIGAQKLSSMLLILGQMLKVLHLENQNVNPILEETEYLVTGLLYRSDDTNYQSSPLLLAKLNRN